MDFEQIDDIIRSKIDFYERKREICYCCDNIDWAIKYGIKQTALKEILNELKTACEKELQDLQ